MLRFAKLYYISLIHQVVVLVCRNVEGASQSALTSRLFGYRTFVIEEIHDRSCAICSVEKTLRIMLHGGTTQRLGQAGFIGFRVK